MFLGCLRIMQSNGKRKEKENTSDGFCAFSLQGAVPLWLARSQSLPEAVGLLVARRVCRCSIPVLIASQKERQFVLKRAHMFWLLAYVTSLFYVLSWQIIQNYMCFCIGFFDVFHWAWSVGDEESGKGQENIWNSLPMCNAGLYHGPVQWLA